MKKFQDMRTHLDEGVYDPNIFKAIFLAGGPGSGKSFVVRRTTGGSGLKVVNSDDVFEKYLKDAGLSLKMPKSEEEPRDKIRDIAKRVTASRQANYIEGRLGIIIDGTGRESEKILYQKRQLEELGYDTYMIFVNTSLDTALQRNAVRSRSVPPSIVTKSWKDVQSNIGLFSNSFRAGMIIVDNNDAGEDIFKEVWKRVGGLLKKKVTNTRAQNWISTELAKKER
jgi:dephospho-CoA kinase